MLNLIEALYKAGQTFSYHGQDELIIWGAYYVRIEVTGEYSIWRDDYIFVVRGTAEDIIQWLED